MVFSAVSMVSSFEADDDAIWSERNKTRTKQQLYASLHHIDSLKLFFFLFLF